MADQTLQTLHSFLKVNDTKVSSGGIVKSYSHDTGSGPVLCMVHGYPESAYMWRHIVPLVKDKHSLFIPELPGYGFSSLPPKSDKRTVGNLVIEALQQVFGTDRKILYCGHDRGARVGHRLLVDNSPQHNLLAGILIDVVPTLEQWRAFATPAAAVGYYHWPFLATDVAPAMIEAMGGNYWCHTCLTRIQGKSEQGVAKFKADFAWEHYCHQYNQPECISGSCADYAAGAREDVVEQEEDQKAGRKVELPTLVLYSSSNLGKVHDVPGVWKQWCEGELKCRGAEDGIGHFVLEEDPEWSARQILEWAEHVGK